MGRGEQRTRTKGEEGGEETGNENSEGKKRKRGKKKKKIEVAKTTSELTDFKFCAG